MKIWQTAVIAGSLGALGFTGGSILGAAVGSEPVPSLEAQVQDLEVQLQDVQEDEELCRTVATGLRIVEGYLRDALVDSSEVLGSPFSFNQKSADSALENVKKANAMSGALNGMCVD